jgi:hypothetical protein
MKKDLQFIESKSDMIENLEAIELNLIQCLDEKMLDFQNTYYNQILDLVEEVRNASTWTELSDALSKAKILEVDIANWLARHGQASISLPWPKIPMDLL